MSSPVDPRASHPDAPDGKADKYALVELERRFLLAASPVGVPIRRWLIEDRYLLGTRIRLRRMTDLDEAAGVTYKLTQKIPTGAGTPGLITTMYLSAAEYAALVTMPADTLRKIRSSFPPLGVDTFEGALHGLVLAEAEVRERGRRGEISAIRAGRSRGDHGPPVRGWTPRDNGCR